MFSRTIGAYILKKNGEFIKSTNTVLNDWLIENGVYVNDHLKPFSDGTIPIHSRGGILIIDEDLNILNNINTEDGLATPEVNITFIDNNDVLYLGTTVGASISYSS